MQVINTTSLPSSVIEQAVYNVAETVNSWRKQPPLSMFTRGTFYQPTTRQEALHAASVAATDPVVFSALEQLEGVTLKDISFESSDEATANLFSEIAEDIDLESVIRRQFRELMIYGLFTAANWWSGSEKRVDYTTPSGQTRRKNLFVSAPERVSILDVTKVIPLSTGPWGTKKLLYQLEEPRIASEGDGADRLFSGPFSPSPEQGEELIVAGSTNIGGLQVLDPSVVWQHTLTCPDYLLYPEPSLRPVLPLLELKARLMDADRSALIGAANYILIISVGTENEPSESEEKQAYRDGLESLARLPVIIGDHRLKVEILAPPTDATLNNDKHSVVDSAIYAMMLGLPPRAVLHEIDQEVMATIAAGRLNSIRKQLGKSLEKNIIKEVIRRSNSTVEKASVSFNPKEVRLYDLNTMLQAVLAARQRREISREAYLGFLGFDQQVEAMRMEQEALQYDEIFKTAQPFDSPSNNQSGGGLPDGAYGPTGGRPTGRKDTNTRARGNKE